MNSIESFSLLSLFLSGLLAVGPSDLEAIGLVSDAAAPDIFYEVSNKYDHLKSKFPKSVFLNSNHHTLIKFLMRYMSGAILSTNMSGAMFAPFLKDYCKVSDFGFVKNVDCNVNGVFKMKGKAMLLFGTFSSWSLVLKNGVTLRGKE